MICPQCGNIVPDSAGVCDECGMILKTREKGTGVASIRQGRSGSEAVRSDRGSAYTAPVPEGRPAYAGGTETLSASDETPGASAEGRSAFRSRRVHRVRRLMINWALVWTVLLVLVLLAAGSAYIYLKTSDAGQLILARLGYDANAEALWALGTEYLDQGYIERAIMSYESAYALDPDREDIYTKLLMLGEAYEAGGYYGKAEDLYTRMYTTIDPSNVTAYRLVANILTSQNRYMELSGFLKMAYTATKDASFSRQREELIPAVPTATLAAGKYQLSMGDNEQYKTVELVSSEGYDIYYLMDGTTDAVLPDDGTLYEHPIQLPEGYHTLRAVALSSELVSDEMSTSYTITSPVPLSPKLSLAPGTYETKQRVWIRYNGDDADSVIIYYTIDGLTPTSNSPIYTGEPVILPGGRVHVKAIAVNTYKKVSNEMDVELKINIPFKRYYNASDTCGDFVMLQTTRETFIKRYGAPLSEEDIVDPIALRCIRLTYDWGFAKFMTSSNGFVIYDFQTSSPNFNGPRSTKIGQDLAAITDKYRDMGQAYNQNGDRSIYWDDAEGFAKLYKLDNQNCRLDYVYYTEDDGTVTLSYYLTDNSVTQIRVQYHN